MRRQPAGGGGSRVSVMKATSAAVCRPGIPSKFAAAAMSYKDEEATALGQSPSQFAVRREDSASTAAGHIRLELVDDKIGECFVKGKMQTINSTKGGSSPQQTTLQIPTTEA